jgi:hypothetical protein
MAHNEIGHACVADFCVVIAVFHSMIILIDCFSTIIQ